MLSSPLFPLPDGLEITSVSETPEEVLVYVTSYRSSSSCPHCLMPSSAIHSSYRRHPKDLPCAGRPIRLVFTVRKFFCRNPDCSRKVFTERLADFIETRKDLDQKEQMRLDQLLNLSPEVQTTYALLQAFLSMVRERNHHDLPSWMEQAAKRGIPELGSFVTGIEQDYDAVHAALRLPWSQGITEGKVNKLKTLKRVMYGRAGFPLLRQRLLHDA